MAQRRLGGDELLRLLAALSNPHRLRILARLAEERSYVSQLARDVGISRPLLIMHLKRLEEAGLVSSTLELSPEGKAVRFYQVEPFELVIDPGVITHAAQTLTEDNPD